MKERSTNEKDTRLRRGGSLQIRFDCASKRPLQQLRTYHKQRGPFMARDHPTYIFLVIWHLTSEILLLSIDNFQEFGIIKASSYTRLIIVSQWYVCIFNSVFSYNYLFSILSLMILHVIIIIIFLNYFLIRNVIIVVNVLIQIAILRIEIEANFFKIHILSEIFQTKFSYIPSLFIINQHVIVVILSLHPTGKTLIILRNARIVRD